MSAVSAVRISQREFARREKCDEKLVRRAIAEGRLPRDDDKKLDAALVDTAWRRGNLGKAATGADAADSADTQAAARTLTSEVHGGASAPAPAADNGKGGVSRDPTYAQAMAKKEHFAAERAEMEFRKRQGQLVEVDTARELLFSESRRGRDHWMNWPSRVAATMAGELGIEADRLAVALTTHVHRHLELLAEPDGHELAAPR